MKKHLWVSASEAAFFLVLFCFAPFRAFWAEQISPALLKLLSAVGSALPFSISESASLLLILAGIVRMTVGLFRRSLLSAYVQILKSLRALLLSFLAVWMAVWLPLCLTQEGIQISADVQQLSAACDTLIRELNASEHAFPETPLPAKTALFPFWMDVCGISGFCSFFTGETLISPRLSSVGAPFAAMHEQMHLRGIADEGRANIEAYLNCVDRGGAFAYSARIWALQYTLSVLYEKNPSVYRECRERMDPDTARDLRSIGGGLPFPKAKLTADIFSVGDYEVLAYMLAAEETGCYNQGNA